MNLVDYKVIKVLSEPVQKYGMWFVDVEAEGWSEACKTKVMVQTLEEALFVKPGYVFQQ